MASKTLAKAIDKLDSYLQNARGAAGSPKAVSILNDLVAIQRHVQANGQNISNFASIEKKLNQIKELLGMNNG